MKCKINICFFLNLCFFLIYKSSVIWNSVKNIFKINDPATSVSIFKLKLKTYLLNKQLLGDAANWAENNFIQL